MRKLFLLAMAIVFLAACQSDDNTPEVGVEGKWNLVEVQGGWDSTVTPVSEDYPYSESYEFRANGTFVKFNSHLGIELTGTYEEEIYESPEGDIYPGIKILTLTFDPEILEEILETDESGRTIYWSYDPHFWIIYSAHDPIETMYLRTDGSIANHGRGWADTPVFYYRK